VLRRPDRLLLERGPVPARAHLWPGDDRAAQVILLDPSSVPTPDAFRGWAGQLARQGITTMRTGALAPRHAEQAEAAGLHCIQELALLEARPPLRAVSDGLDRLRHGEPMRTSACRDGRLGDHDFDDMAEIDHAAFGDLWRLDARMLRDVCSATPAFRARVVRDPPARVPRLHRTPPVGFLISGRAGRVGYIQRLAVHPAQHRRGVASALLHDAFTWMGRWRADRVLVNTHVENHPALALYRTHGFVDLPERLRVYEGSTEA
jgi:ribosomal protein S18 acetylase RimI-like enzyme